MFAAFSNVILAYITCMESSTLKVASLISKHHFVTIGFVSSQKGVLYTTFSLSLPANLNIQLNTFKMGGEFFKGG